MKSSDSQQQLLATFETQTNPTLTSSPTTVSDELALEHTKTSSPKDSQKESDKYISEEFGISFWLPESFYWNGGRSTKGEGPFTTPYILGNNSEVTHRDGKISCNLMSTFLKNPSDCSDGDTITYLMVEYFDPTASANIPVFMVGTPSWVPFEDSIGCSECTYWYDQDVTVLGNTYKVKVYYSLNSSGEKITEGIQLEGYVHASSKSKWNYVGIEPFIGFQDSDVTGPDAGLSQTSRKVLESLEYIN